MKRNKRKSARTGERKSSGRKNRKKFGQFIYCSTPKAFADAASQKFIELVNENIAATNKCSIALSGGNTPLPMFRKLASEFRDKTDWEKINIFWVDERCVPPDNPDSNFGNANREFISKLPIKNYFRMEGDLEPSLAAARYEKLLREKFKLKKKRIPVFDLICLGMGNDGHTASLFPGSELLKEKKKPVVSGFVKQMNQSRITLTLPVLNKAKKRLFLIAGKEKIKILNEIFSKSRKRYPVRKLFPSKAQNIWIILQ